MHGGNEDGSERRRHELGIGVLMALAGLMVLAGTWREMAHHDGLLLVVVPASMMPVLSALLARRAARDKKQP
jgi:hypothetical protein